MRLPQFAAISARPASRTGTASQPMIGRLQPILAALLATFIVAAQVTCSCMATASIAPSLAPSLARTTRTCCQHRPAAGDRSLPSRDHRSQRCPHCNAAAAMTVPGASSAIAPQTIAALPPLDLAQPFASACPQTIAPVATDPAIPRPATSLLAQHCALIA